jgi:hypothetical protein
MRDCAFCNPLRPLYQWKSGDGRFYCNEFCADASEGDRAFKSRGEFYAHAAQAFDATPTRSRQSL